MSLLGWKSPGRKRYRPPDTVWDHVTIHGHITNRRSSAYTMSERLYPREKRRRRVFYPKFSMRLWQYEHPIQYAFFHPRSKWSSGMTGAEIVRHRRLMQERRPWQSAHIKKRSYRQTRRSICAS